MYPERLDHGIGELSNCTVFPYACIGQACALWSQMHAAKCTVISCERRRALVHRDDRQPNKGCADTILIDSSDTCASSGHVMQICVPLRKHTTWSASLRRYIADNVEARADQRTMQNAASAILSTADNFHHYDASMLLHGAQSCPKELRTGHTHHLELAGPFEPWNMITAAWTLQSKYHFTSSQQ